MTKHIYIHIPFCKSKCPYCAFGSHIKKEALHKSYFDALYKEMKSYFSAKKEMIETLFIGGGTPTSVDSLYYEKLFKIVEPFLEKECELTIESNPNSINLDYLKKLKSLGINRISFGVQSFRDEKLKFLGRTHSKDEAIEAINLAFRAKIEKINIDLIYATKLDSKKTLLSELYIVGQLPISSISAYTLMLEPNTPFFGKKSYQKESAGVSKFMIESIERLKFKQYEISNFGQVCRHNLAYWEQKNYYGFGAYSVGFIDDKRVYAPSNLKDYIANPLQKEIENLTVCDLRLEHIFLGLRSILGIQKAKITKKEQERAKILTKEGLLREDEERFYNNNFLLSDEIVLFLTSQN